MTCVWQEIGGAMILRDIYFGGSIVSLILLVMALFIFSYFKYTANWLFICSQLLLSRPCLRRESAGHQTNAGIA